MKLVKPKKGTTMETVGKGRRFRVSVSALTLGHSSRSMGVRGLLHETID